MLHFQLKHEEMNSLFDKNVLKTRYFKSSVFSLSGLIFWNLCQVCLTWSLYIYVSNLDIIIIVSIRVFLIFS